MNKDNFNHDYIYDKIKKGTENIQIPDSLQPQEVEKRLADVEQTGVVKRFSFRPSFAAVACLVLVCGIVLALIPLFRKEKFEPVKVAEGPSNSYEDICTVINNYYEDLNEETDTNFIEDAFSVTKDSASVDSGFSNSSDYTNGSYQKADYSETDMQVDNVLEGDIVKTDGSHIFTLQNTTLGYCVNIYKAEGANVEKTSEINVLEADCNEMYIDGTTLILLSGEWELDPDYTNEDRIEWLEEGYTLNEIQRIMYKSDTMNRTRIEMYDISDATNPSKTYSHTQSGFYNTSRLTGGYLYTFTDYTLYEQDYSQDKPEEFMPKLDDTFMQASDVYLPENSMSNTFMVMSSLNLKNPTNFTDSIAALGNFDTYYMNASHIYTVNSGNRWNDEKTTIAKYAYENGKFEYKTSTKVRGEIENSYYMHEYDGNFVFVYTTSDKLSTITNGLCVLDENLDFLGEISDLGIDEEIYSSYFIDNMAYFVTFRNTDPVYAVDISNPKKPTLKSELKLPGFSDYLHSFGDNMLLGIGQGSTKENSLDTDSVKLSLFSINNNYEIEEKDTLAVGTNTDSYAGTNHKVVFIDEERGLIGLGIEPYSGSNFYAIYKYENGKLKKYWHILPSTVQ